MAIRPQIGPGTIAIVPYIGAFPVSAITAVTAM